MKPGLIDRRRLLRGAGSIAIALPVIEAMGDPLQWTGIGPREARAATGVPKRFVTVFVSSGTLIDKWRPVGTPASYTMGPILKPLEPLKDKLVVVDGLLGKGSNGEGHTERMGAALTGMPLNPTSGGNGFATGISVDQVLANDIGTQTKVKSLELSVGPITSSVWGRLSYLGNNQPIPPEGDPQKVFTRLFTATGGSTSSTEAATLRAQRRSVLDSVLEDYAALSKRLGTSDRVRMDQHLTSIRDIEMRLDVVTDVGGACPAVAPPAATDFATVGKLQMDLLVMALACDRTRVATFLWEQAADNRRFGFIGVDDEHHNGIHNSHFDNVQKMLTWYSEQHAYLLNKMKAVTEASGTLLDNSVVFFTSEQSDGTNHTSNNMPYLLAGNAGGALKTGRWLKFSGNPPHNNLLVSILNMMGNTATTFGKADWCTGPVPGLL